ncbi:hypothetical protein [Gulosibacter sp. 10]|uniref:hypothetical protein n=1 Tax=Gulosibacter sp. 10 TaxID=1255570 RepID=UPI00097E8C50|nr:hypothetical protein [Gulosibacter sp. 10]SJM59389.1 hypothetical protein FM112_06450 [Gulosibacter sp. 10]
MADTPNELWNAFLAKKGRTLQPDVDVALGQSHEWQRGSFGLAPDFSELLQTTTVTPVRMSGVDYELLTWGEGDALRGWFTAMPQDVGDALVHPMQRELLAVFGGILEVFGTNPQPADGGWWLNQRAILSSEAYSLGKQFPEYVRASDWAWEDAGLEFDFDPEPFVGIAAEANSNLTMLHTGTGQVVAFLPDHSYGGVTPLEGCPEYTLYTHDEAQDFASWLDWLGRTWPTA